jgi:uncharacterized membrane protein YhhN
MPNILIVVLAIILLSVLLYFENKQQIKGLLPTKTLLSSLFILTALLQPHPMLRYYHFMLAGLLVCLAGDVLLALPREKMFLWGLIAFLLGHVFYIFAFLNITRSGPWTWMGTLIILIVSSGIYFKLRPHLGTMKIPVLCYCMVISVMLAGAWSIFADSGLTRPGRMMVFSGALFFYISDIFVARDRFLKKEFFNRLIGLPLYYAGQFLLAFSVGLLRPY